MSGISLNEDNSHFFTSRGNDQSKMSEAGLRELVDHYASPQMKELIFSVNSMRASFASSTVDPIWKGVEDRDGVMYFRGRPQPESFRNWALNAKKFADDGLDPYVFLLAESRRRGISPWITVRMNDVHNVGDEEDLLHSDWWREHPEARRSNYRIVEWSDRAFDYEREDVRTRMLAFIEECFQRYDMDGLELDWMRFGFNFKPGREAYGAAVLLGFMKHVRDLAQTWGKRRGHEIKIGVRVPSRPEAAVEIGLDAMAWVDAGLVDTVVVTPFWSSTDTDIPIRLWRRLLGDKITLAAGLELNSRPYPASEPITNTAAIVMANAANYLAQGADRIYLFNYMDSETCVENYADQEEILAKAGTLATAAAEPRRHLVAYPDTAAPGQALGIALPRILKPDCWIDMRVSIGPKPTSGVVKVLLGFAGRETAYHEMIEVRVNEILVKPCASPDFKISPTASARAAWEIPAAILNDGSNVIRLHVTGKLEDTLVWCELDINGNK